MSKKKVGKKDRRSKSSWARELLYRDAKKELIAEWKAKGYWSCIFSGEKMGASPNCHHLFSRVGGNLYDKSGLTFCKQKWHMAWHNEPIEKIMSYPWWAGFLERIHERHPDRVEEILQQIQDRIDKSK